MSSLRGPASARSGSGSLLSPLSPCFEPGLLLVEGVPGALEVVEGVAEEDVAVGEVEGEEMESEMNGGMNGEINGEVDVEGLGMEEGVGEGERGWTGLESGESGCDSAIGGKSECRAADDNQTSGVNGVDESKDSDSPSKWDSDGEETQAWRDKLRSLSLYIPKSLKAKDKRLSLPYFKNMWSRSRSGSLQSTAG